MRHTAATLWLAAGEAPEWIARQLGHTSTEMLFRTYSRYVPNMTRQDGSAMDRLLASRLAGGPMVRYQPSEGQGHGGAVYVPANEQAPQPVPKPRGIAGHHKRQHPQGDDRGQAPPPRHRWSGSLTQPLSSARH